MILVDTFILEDMEILTEEKDGKKCRKLRGIFQRADEANNNKRVYSKALLEREVGKLADALQERRLMGELDHPSHDSVKLSNVSHLITNLHIKGNDVIGECELLDTPAGKVAQALVAGGVKVGISSRGMGTLSEGADGTKSVNEDFKLVTFDLVADPSTRGAYPALAESNESSLIESIVKDTLDKAAKEKVFTTLLKQKLDEKTTKKSSKKDPLSIWRGDADFGYNSRKPRKRSKERTYDNAEEPTETLKVQEYAGGHGGNPHTGEPEHLAAQRRSNEMGQNMTNKKAVAKKSKPGRFSTVKAALKKALTPKQNSSTEYSLVRSALDTKLREEESKKKEGKKTYKLGSRELLKRSGAKPRFTSKKVQDMKTKADNFAKQAKEGKIDQELLDMLARKDSIKINPGTGKDPKKGRRWGDTDPTK
tara:strand:- start:1233 stop:2498 length:1266 start_codon:yes stop_codon:yes gene_type:complete